MTNVIETNGLRKAYRHRRGIRLVVDGLDLKVPEGGVFGLLGPNGSGKTTIQCLLGAVDRIDTRRIDECPKVNQAARAYGLTVCGDEDQ